MPDNDRFLNRVVAARKAAWLVFLVAVGIQMISYGAYLAMQGGGLDGLIESGLWGDISSDEASRLMFHYVAALKLMSTAILMGALFLTLWVRGLRRID